MVHSDEQKFFYCVTKNSKARKMYFKVDALSLKVICIFIHDSTYNHFLRCLYKDTVLHDVISAHQKI